MMNMWKISVYLAERRLAESNGLAISEGTPCTDPAYSLSMGCWEGPCCACWEREKKLMCWSWSDTRKKRWRWTFFLSAHCWNDLSNLLRRCPCWEDDCNGLQPQILQWLWASSILPQASISVWVSAFLLSLVPVKSLYYWHNTFFQIMFWSS